MTIQRLIPRTTAASQPAQHGQPPKPIASIAEGIRARVRDPLWLLARQWQMGEFEAANAGSTCRVEVTQRCEHVDRVRMTGAHGPIANPDVSLEATIESANGTRQLGAGDAPAAQAHGAWDGKALHYRFQLHGTGWLRRTKLGGASLVGGARDVQYHGERLDWYDFGLAAEHIGGDAQTTTVFPARARFRGLPGRRWWELEDEHVDLSALELTEPNPLALLLLEFGLIQGEDWFVIPLRQRVGTVRKIEKLVAFDAFGRRTEIPPHTQRGTRDDAFHMFGMPCQRWSGWRSEITSRYLYLPNATTRTAHATMLTGVVFQRDEVANLVWAVELPEPGPPEVASTRDAAHADPDAITRWRYRVAPDLPANRVPYAARAIRERWWFVLLVWLVDALPRAMRRMPDPTGQRWFYRFLHGGFARLAGVCPAVSARLRRVGTAELVRHRTRTELDDRFDLVPQYQTAIVGDSAVLSEGAVLSVPVKVAEHLSIALRRDQRWEFEPLADGRYHAVPLPDSWFAWTGRTRRYALPPAPFVLDYDVVSREYQ